MLLARRYKVGDRIPGSWSDGTIGETYEIVGIEPYRHSYQVKMVMKNQLSANWSSWVDKDWLNQEQQ